MAKVSKTGGYSVNGASTWQPKRRGWEQTPKWHWRYWFGYRMRLYDDPGFAHYDPGWAYRTFKQHASAVLKEIGNGRHHDNAGTETEARSANYTVPRRRRHI